MMEVTLNNGATTPALGLGVFQSPPEQMTAAVEAALAVGYRHIDTPAAYDNERDVGEGVRSSGRSEVFIETKVWVSDYGYEPTLHAWEKAGTPNLASTIWTCSFCTSPHPIASK
jgi:2,5-diketo-D-gluconate reductase A